MAHYISDLPSEAWQNTWPRQLTILGSTGSIGTSTLDVVRSSNGSLLPIGLAAGKNISLLAEQAVEFRPSHLAISRKEDVELLLALLPCDYKPMIVTGQEGYETLATLAEASLVVSAQSGAAGLRGTMAAVEAGKVVALANKESLVLAGELIRKKCGETGAVLLPVDSEHNAIFQCLAGNRLHDVKRLIITASGGPFLGKTQEELACVSIHDALNHPNWSMGAKISIDSATLMNKGLEVIEAYHLFGLPLDQIDVIIHRQSIVHSLVEYNDNSLLAEMGAPDMRAAISYCLHWPKRVTTKVKPLDLGTLGSLVFEECKNLPSPCLDLARQSLLANNGCEIALNAANEVAVKAFLEGNIAFIHIASIVKATCESYLASASSCRPSTLEAILEQDALCRDKAEKIIQSIAQ